jgi:hypothetical protein
MDTLLCNDDGDIVIGTYDPSNTLLRLSADQYTAGSATWADQSGNGLNFTVSTNTSLKGTDADGFPYMNFSGSYGIAKRIVGSSLTNITAPTTGKYTIFCVTQMLGTTTSRTLTRGATADHQVYVNNNTNNLGLYDNSGSNFRDSGFDVTTVMSSSRNLLTWELSTSSPIYNFQLNESGTNSTITSATNYTLPFCCIGGYHGGSTVASPYQYWGNIYEFIVYDGFLSASVRDYVAEYLAYKWDISSKLPSLTSTHVVIVTLPDGGSPEFPVPSANYLVTNNISSVNGLYWIKPYGYSGEAFQVYCDLTGDESGIGSGGWMRVKYAADLYTQANPWKLAGGFAYSGDFTFTYTNEQINAMKATASEIRQTLDSYAKGSVGWTYNGGTYMGCKTLNGSIFNSTSGVINLPTNTDYGFNGWNSSGVIEPRGTDPTDANDQVWRQGLIYLVESGNTYLPILGIYNRDVDDANEQRYFPLVSGDETFIWIR